MFRSKLDLNELELRGRSGNIKATTNVYILLNFPPTQMTVFWTAVHRCSCALINLRGPSRGIIMNARWEAERLAFHSLSSSALFSLHSVCGGRGLQSSIHKQWLVFLTLCTDFLSYLLYFQSVLVRPACLGGLVRDDAHACTQNQFCILALEQLQLKWIYVVMKWNESVVTGTCDCRATLRPKKSTQTSAQ